SSVDGHQDAANVAALSTGGFVVVWEANTFEVNDVNQSGIVAQRYAADGTPLGSFGNLSGPQGLAVGPNGNLFAGSFNDGLVNEYDPVTFELLGTFADVEGSTTNNFTFGPVVPEPTSIAMLGSASLLVLRRCRF
ncbi:MAG: PEP-CTERM sorting domain-containing protein, partial [Planctomycetota bacterium]